MMKDNSPVGADSPPTIFHISTPKQGPFDFLCGRVQDPVATVSVKYVARIPEALMCSHCLERFKDSQFPAEQVKHVF